MPLFCNDAPADGKFSLLNILEMINNDDTLFGSNTKRMRQTTFNNSSYENSKTALAYRFMEALELNDGLKRLTELVKDPKNPNVLIERFYLECRGESEEHIQKVVNACLIQLSVCLVKAGWVGKKFETPLQFAEAQYQPNCVAKMLRTLFSHFKKKGVPYRLSKDFNGTGKFNFSFVFVATEIYVLNVLLTF